jgi:hypothetical protein
LLLLLAPLTGQSIFLDVQRPLITPTLVTHTSPLITPS